MNSSVVVSFLFYEPADVCIPRHAGGKDCAIVVTVVNPLQAALVVQAAETPGHALAIAHKRKLDKSWQSCNAQGIVFLPLVVESLGAWHKSAISEVKKLGSSLARHTGGVHHHPPPLPATLHCPCQGQRCSVQQPNPQ